jgi:threonine/homoserine/homoserine lactone efflux protein
LLTVAGNELGLCVQVAAVAFGIGALVERLAEIFMVVKWAGAAYLVYLGLSAADPGRRDVLTPGAGCRQRSGLNAARISVANSSGSSQAAKWPPLSTSWK